MRELRFKPKRFRYVHEKYENGTLYRMTEQFYPGSNFVWVKGLGLDYWSCIKFKNHDEFLKWKQQEDLVFNFAVDSVVKKYTVQDWIEFYSNL